MQRTLALVVALLLVALGCTSARADVTVEFTGRVSPYIDTDFLTNDFPWKTVRPGEFVHVYFDVRDRGPTQLSPTQMGSCCNPADGTCTVYAKSYCQSIGRTWTSGSCNAPCANTGRCCKAATGGCSVITQTACTSQGGVWTAGGTCAAACIAAGACCDPATGLCTVVYQGTCAANGGTWTGATTCNAPCAGSGKCCNPGDGSCVVMAQAVCTSNGGTWTSGTCSTPCSGSGKCCFPDGHCATVTSATCSSFGGTFTAGQTCNIQCAGASKCCNPASGACSMLLQAECEGQGFIWSSGASCTTAPCGDIGACCNSTTGACSIVSQFSCTSGGGTWTSGATCATVVCAGAGACCDPVNHTCTVVFQASCPPQNNWNACLACDVLCPGPNAKVLTAYDIVPGSFRMTIQSAEAGVLQGGTPYDDCTNPDNLSSPNLWVRDNDPGVDGFHLEGAPLFDANHTPLYGLDIILAGGGPVDSNCNSTPPTWLNSTDILQAYGAYPGSLFNGSRSWEIVRAIPPMNVFIDIEQVVVSPTGTATGSCCPGDGHCVVTTQQACPGTWVSGGACTAGLCAPAGACCLSTGGCALLTQSACGAVAGSIYNGNGTSCRTTACAVIGACCSGSGCSQKTQAACVSGGGTWLGAGESCDKTPQITSGPLGTTAGACCIINGECAMKYPTACTAPYTFLAGETCAANACSAVFATGKCCNPLSGECRVDLETSCINITNGWGIWTAGGTCDLPCANSGACCSSVDGACTVVFKAQCDLVSGTWTAGAMCAAPCPSTGKCCNGFDGTCTVVTQSACTGFGGIWTAGASCAAPCPASGKCCNGFDNSCTVIDEPTCLGFGGIWTAGATCSTPCADSGRCCNAQTGACTVVSQAACPTTTTSIWTSGGTCDAPCFVFGKCCNLSNVCTTVSQASCLAIGGMWSATDTCATPCLGQGRCCNAFDGSCTIKTQQSCVVDGNSTWTEGLTCASPCIGDLILNDAVFDVPSQTTIPATYTSSIVIPPSNSQTTQGLEVWLDITLNRANDLRVTLTGPNNVTVDLFTRIGGTGPTCSTVVIGPGYTMDGAYIFEDAASQSFHTHATGMCPGSHTSAGRYKPAGCAGAPVSFSAAFGSIPLAGTWTLTIVDERSGVAATLRSWGVSSQGGNPAPCVTGACCNGNSCAITTFAACTGTWKGGTCGAGNTCPGSGSTFCCRGTTCNPVTAGSCTGVIAGSNSIVRASCGAGNAFATCCYADYNHDGLQSIDDLFLYFNAYFTSNPMADFGGTGISQPTIDDLFLYINAYFGTCS